MDAYKNTRGYCTNYTIDGSVLLVNTDMLKEMGIEVNGYADLLQPELVGKIASADPASSSSAFCQLTNMLLAMGGYEDDAAWKYVEICSSASRSPSPAVPPRCIRAFTTANTPSA